MNRYDEFREQVVSDGYSFVESALLTAAFELNVFEALGGESKSVPTIAAEIKADERALELLLNALASLNLISKTGIGFQLSEAGKYIFLKQSEKYIGDIVRHQKLMTQSFLELSETVRTGKPLVFSAGGLESQSAEWMRDFTCAMHNTAVGHAETLARKLDLKGAKTLIDIGGGSGAFSIYFLKQNPGLMATIYDLPTTLQTTREFVEKYGMTERVQYHAGNFEQDGIQGKYDIAFLSHIIHGTGAGKNEILFKKIFDALNPGGRLIIQDFFLNEDKISPQFSALFALNMLLHTEGGQTYTFGEVENWARKAGFSGCTRPSLRLPRSISILVAAKT